MAKNAKESGRGIGDALENIKQIQENSAYKKKFDNVDIEENEEKEVVKNKVTELKTKTKKDDNDGDQEETFRRGYNVTKKNLAQLQMIKAKAPDKTLNEIIQEAIDFLWRAKYMDMPDPF